ncbi:zinc transporter 2-like isoform X2 [Parambassis ranga]|uniref:Probable proton-coupled zinc antiporter SLC30A3 n=1 Tax=Parambassis ranga TaxID=210632 RepID=A0A6P7HG57_9TELE|nr:zinc transporter 2-like isoform X2 [Parambassis ranga]
MKLSMDSEKQPLIEAQMEPLTGPPDSRHMCSDLEFSDEASGVDVPEWLCWETGTMLGTESDTRHRARRKLLIAAAVSLVFMTGEVIGKLHEFLLTFYATCTPSSSGSLKRSVSSAGGYAAHSLAIMTDAAHLLTDFGSITVSIFSLWISGRPPTETMSFGWHRAEILGVLLSVVSIWAVTAVLVLTAIQRIRDGDYEIESQIMLLTSGCAVGVNVLMVLILHQSGTSHGHSHRFPSSQQQVDKHSQTDGHSHSNASVKAAFIHVVGDLLQSVGVLLAAAIIHVWVSVSRNRSTFLQDLPLITFMHPSQPQYKVADPICTLLFSAVVVGTTLLLTKDVFRILMEASPQNLSNSAVRELLLSVRGVTAVHSLHMWSLNMTHILLSVHVATEEDADSQLILRRTTKLLRSEFGFSSITVQVERGRTSADSHQ